MEASLALFRSLAFIEEMTTAIKPTSPTAIMSMPPLGVPTSCWMIEEGSLDILKVGGQVLDATPPIDAMTP